MENLSSLRLSIDPARTGGSRSKTGPSPSLHRAFSPDVAQAHGGAFKVHGTPEGEHPRFPSPPPRCPTPTPELAGSAHSILTSGPKAALTLGSCSLVKVGGRREGPPPVVTLLVPFQHRTCSQAPESGPCLPSGLHPAQPAHHRRLSPH